MKQKILLLLLLAAVILFSASCKEKEYTELTYRNGVWYLETPAPAESDS